MLNELNSFAVLEQSKTCTTIRREYMWTQTIKSLFYANSIYFEVIHHVYGTELCQGYRLLGRLVPENKASPVHVQDYVEFMV